MRRVLVLALLFTLLPVERLVACLWDSETLMQEREKFPGTLELITGKFLRHSDAYYRWRLADRLKKLGDDPENDVWLDDVAVSHEKLGEYDEAIAVAQAQLERQPDRYESLANLGTFLIHAGRYQEGLEFIDRALAVNPDAHFGREKYQRALVRYILKQVPEGEMTLPLQRIRKPPAQFSSFLAMELSDGANKTLEGPELQSAIEGVSGMMRFSKHDNPILLEVLGELLLSPNAPKFDAKRLAARAYYQASYLVEGDARAEYRSLAEDALSMQVAKSGSSSPVEPRKIERQFKDELKDSKVWFGQLAKNEARWIEEGQDVDAKFNEYYRDAPQAGAPPIGIDKPVSKRSVFMIVGLIFLACAAVLYLLRRWMLAGAAPRARQI